MYNKYKIYLPLVPIVVLLSWLLIQAIPAPYSDFAGYYFGSKALLHGEYHHVYDTFSLNLLIEEQGYKNIFVSYSPFPPFTSLVMWPFLYIPPQWSKLVFNAFSCVLFVITLWRSIRFFSLPSWWMIVIPVLFFVPLRNNILFGQAYLLLFVLLLEGYIAYKKGRVILSSLIWAIAILFKLFPVLIVLFLLFRKKYRNIAYLAVTGALLLLLSICINGFAAWKFYLLEMFPRAGNGELNNSFAYQFQSVCMLLRSVFVYDTLLNPSPLSVHPHTAIWLLAAWKAFVFTACIGCSLQRKGTDFVVFAMWITGSMLISPNGSSYSLILLLLPLLAVPAITIEQGKKGGVMIAVALALLWLINNIPVYKLGNLSVLLRFPRLYILILFFCLLLAAMKIRIHYGILVMLMAVFVLIDLRKLLPEKDNSTYVLAKEEHLLMYDYNFINGTLVYYYRDDMGDQELTTQDTVTGYTSNGVSLINNQVYYYNTQLTFSGDWKKKPMLVNNNCIFYLSDKNRGVGFYTLRKIILPSSR